ncbi:MAG: enolase [Planctomycetes bacterium]|nr:enolase [Planctomycetota bacterium]
MPKITNIERIWVDVPFKEVPARNMVRELPHWTLFELCKVTLDNGVVGVGETMVYYTWGMVTDEAVDRAQGANPAEIMWDDALGAGLQMACFDAVGRTLQTPVWALLGTKVRDRAHIGWWAIDMPVEDWITECQEAIRSGYTSFKTKARPWWDLEDQVARLCESVPRYFAIDMDFNDFGLDPTVAKRLCKSLERFPQVAIWESPIRQEDVAGNRDLRRHLDVPIAHHVGRPQMTTQLTQDICDGFVVEGGAERATRHGTICAEFNKPFWLQWVGTGITTTMALHVQAVLSHARWPAINCNHMYEHQLISAPLHVCNGLADIPNGPGLGVEVDWKAVERYRIEPIEKPYPYPGLLLRLDWPSGAKVYFTHAQQLWEEFSGGRLSTFMPGVNLTSVEDDGTDAWRDLQQKAQAGPVYVDE